MTNEKFKFGEILSFYFKNVIRYLVKFSIIIKSMNYKIFEEGTKYKQIKCFISRYLRGWLLALILS